MIERPVTQQELDRLHAAWESAPESRSFAPLADAYHRAGRNEEAIELLHSGTVRHPDYLSALVLLADCYEALERTEEASAIFARVLSQDEENIRALEHQASQSIQQGALGKAAALVEKLRQIDPWDATIRRLSAQLQQAPAAPSLELPMDPPRAGEFQSTIRLPKPGPQSGAAVPPVIEPNVAAAPSSDELSTLTLAQIYESQGYLQKALTIYERLLQQHPGNAQVGQRLDELRRRLSGVDETAHAGNAEALSPEPPVEQGSAYPPAADEQLPAPSGSRWRLVDEDSLGSLQPSPSPSMTTPASGSDAPPDRSRASTSADDAASRDEDFQRFLRYVRSLSR